MAPVTTDRGWRPPPAQHPYDAEESNSLCDEENKFKTGTDVTVELTLDIDGEVVSALPQITILYYYELDGRKVYFSLFAKDILATKVVDFGVANSLTVRQITIVSEVIEKKIPHEDTENLVIEKCKDVDVKAEITFLDSQGDIQEYLDCNNCDLFIAKMVKSAAEGTV